MAAMKAFWMAECSEHLKAEQMDICLADKMAACLVMMIVDVKAGQKVVVMAEQKEWKSAVD